MDPREYVDAVLQVIKSNPPATPSQGFKVAQLGVLVQRAIPETHWTAVGFRKLKDVLDTLEQRGEVRLGYDDKGAFCVWHVPAEQKQTVQPSPSDTSQSTFLRKEIWNAFVAEAPRGRRYLRRTDGLVRMGVADRLEPTDVWVEIDPISATDQHRWAREFLAEKGLDQDLQLGASIDVHPWYFHFAQGLKARDESLLRAWNWARSKRVCEVVSNWCTSQNVAPENAFQLSRPEPRNHVEQPSVLPGRPVVPQEQRIRVALLSALGRMPTEDLAELSIPARYLLEALGLSLGKHSPTTI